MGILDKQSFDLTEEQALCDVFFVYPFSISGLSWILGDWSLTPSHGVIVSYGRTLYWTPTAGRHPRRKRNGGEGGYCHPLHCRRREIGQEPYFWEYLGYLDSASSFLYIPNITSKAASGKARVTLHNADARAPFLRILGVKINGGD